MKNPNGWGSISKMSGRRRKPWRVRVTTGWTDDGKQQYKNLGTYATRAEAIEALAQWNVTPKDRSDQARREAIVQGLTFADMYNAMLEYRGDKLTDSMRAAYKVAYNNLEPLHQQQFLRIKKPHLQDAFDTCTKSSATKNKMKTLVKAIYKYAIENEITEKDYSSMIDMDPKKNEQEHHPFSEEEIEIIWSHANMGDDIARITILQIYTGCRIAELLDLEKENVYLADQYAMGGKKTDNGKNRIIPFHDRTIPLWDNFYNQDRPFLFANSRGTRMKYDGYGVNFRARMAEWGMSGHQTHDARRTAATRLHVAEVPYSIIQQILGHSSKDVTGKHYIKKDVKQLVKWVNAVK